MHTLRTRFLTLALVAVALFISSCSTVPVTGRSQLNLIPASTMLSMSYQQYGDFMQSHQSSRDQSKVQMVQRVGVNIKNAVESYFKQKGLSDQLQGYKWEFNLVESNEVNAWCMPGGKVVVYSGILPITQNEVGLAVVMGHEIAHAVAEHGSERMSQGLLTQLGGMALNEALASKPAETRALWMTAFGVGAQVGVLLPYSRLHESEADKLGLIFMAMAGYNPNEAVAFWQRMAANKGGAAPPEFLSTHPSDATRIKDLQAAMPEAMKYYKR
ncbi:MAG: M48 family metallopeptidase [Bacteroidetes bacterium]|nr:M48 family metallopeptidase [Bacteroidota bacterium]